MKKIKDLFKTEQPSSLEYIAQHEKKHVKKLTQSNIDQRMERISTDFKHGFELLKDHPDTVTFFGSARLDQDNQYYQQARELARKIVQELGSTIVTGGGSGIMEAANQGATDADGNSIGMAVELPNEQVTNDYVSQTVDFYYFFSRKVALTFTARAYIYFPGGFGTLDEFFEILTLKQTSKIQPLPVVLVGTEFWSPLLEYIDTELKNKLGTIGTNDTELYTLTDDLDEVIRLISPEQE